MPRKVRGDRAFVRILRRLPDAIHKELYDGLDDLGTFMLDEMRASGRFQNKTGALREGLSKRVTPKTLKLKVGLVGKPINRKLFYGLILQLGRKGGGRGVKRGSAKYMAGVGARAPDHFVWGVEGIQQTVSQADRVFRAFWQGVLEQASKGVTDD